MVLKVSGQGNWDSPPGPVVCGLVLPPSGSIPFYMEPEFSTQEERDCTGISAAAEEFLLLIQRSKMFQISFTMNVF